MNTKASPHIDPFATFDFPEGKAAFLGTVRVDDFGVHEFCIDLQGRPPLFGQWEPMCEGFDIDVEISSFGYLSAGNVGNPHPAARVCLSAEEVIAVRKLVVLLFNQSEARNGVFPFSVDKANFTGKVSFRDGWCYQNKQCAS